MIDSMGQPSSCVVKFTKFSIYKFATTIIQLGYSKGQGCFHSTYTYLVSTLTSSYILTRAGPLLGAERAGPGGV